MSSNFPIGPLTGARRQELRGILQALKQHLIQRDPLAHFHRSWTPSGAEKSPENLKLSTAQNAPLDDSSTRRLPRQEALAAPAPFGELTTRQTAHRAPGQLPEVKPPRVGRDFSELTAWLSSNYPEIPLRSERWRGSDRVFVIAPEESGGQEPARAFAAGVACGLQRRGIDAQSLQLQDGEFEGLATSPQHLLLVDANQLSEIQSSLGDRQIRARVLQVDWTACSQSARLKGDLWRAIQNHLRDRR